MRIVNRRGSRVCGPRRASGAALILLCGLLLPGLAGCGSRGDMPELARVRGRVTVHGQPLTGYIVNFMPTGGGRPSVGATGPDGEFDLDYTLKEKGAKVGKHKVFFIYAPESQAEVMAADRGELPEDVRAIVQKYGDMETTPLEVEVTPDKDEYVIELE